MKQILLKFLLLSFTISHTLTFATKKLDLCKSTLLGDLQTSIKNNNFVAFDPCRYLNNVQPEFFTVKDPKSDLLIKCSCDIEDLCSLFRDEVCESEHDEFIIPNLLKPTQENPLGNVICSCKAPLPVATPLVTTNDTTSQNQQLTQILFYSMIASYVLDSIIIIATITKLVLNIKKSKAFAQQADLENDINTLEAQLKLVNIELSRKEMSQERNTSLKNQAANLEKRINEKIVTLSKLNKNIKYIKTALFVNDGVLSGAKAANRELASRGLKTGPGSEILSTLATQVEKHEEDVHKAFNFTIKGSFFNDYELIIAHAISILKDIALGEKIDISQLSLEVKELTEDLEKTFNSLESELKDTQNSDLLDLVSSFKEVLSKSKDIFEEQSKDQSNTDIISAKLESINTTLKKIEDKAETLKTILQSERETSALTQQQQMERALEIYRRAHPINIESLLASAEEFSPAELQQAVLTFAKDAAKIPLPSVKPSENRNKSIKDPNTTLNPENADTNEPQKRFATSENRIIENRTIIEA